MSNVLSRLEAVMGIQIMSVLANVHSQFTASSGVMLVTTYKGRQLTLPDPNKDPVRYIEKVIVWWCMGRSPRPPTWRHLLDVIQDIGLIELSQQIEAFLKGKTVSGIVCIIANHHGLAGILPDFSVLPGSRPVYEIILDFF